MQYIKLHISVIRTIHVSEWLLEQRCSDNRGSTVLVIMYAQYMRVSRQCTFRTKLTGTRTTKINVHNVDYFTVSTQGVLKQQNTDW